MDAKEMRELDAWIELNVFGKKCYSEMRGGYEYFYLVNEEPWLRFRNSEKEKEKYKLRQWSEYNRMKHILPESDLRQFTTSPADAAMVRGKCLEALAKIGRTAEIWIDDAKQYVICAGELRQYAVTEELCWCLFARQLVTEEKR